MHTIGASRSMVGSVSHSIDRWFPAPEYMAPRACGIDISDASIKWLALSPGQPGVRRVLSWGELPISEGIVHEGIVRDIGGLSNALARIVPHLGGIRAAHAALPEEAAYVFGMRVPAGAPHQQILSMIEFEFNDRVPIPPSAAVYDFDAIEQRDGDEEKEIGVVVFPRDVSHAYAAAFERAGIGLLSLEVEARSIARAVSSSEEEDPITLLVDFGRARTGFAVLKRGIPIFTSTVEVGGIAISRAVQKALSMSPEEAQAFSNNEGLLPAAGVRSAGMEALAGTASALADEIARYYNYWDTRRNDRGERVTPVGKIILVGGGANLGGLLEYVAGRVQATVERGNIWRHIARFDDYIPPIDARTSLQFATAAGLALRGS